MQQEIDEASQKWLEEVEGRCRSAYNAGSREPSPFYRLPESIKSYTNRPYDANIVKLGILHDQMINLPLSQIEEKKVEAVQEMVMRLHQRHKTIDDLVEEIQQLNIRGFYDNEAATSWDGNVLLWRLITDGNVLVWRLIMDGCFILEFLSLENKEMVRDCLQWDIFNDIFKLENQIPIALLVKILEVRHGTKEYAEHALARILCQHPPFQQTPLSLNSKSNQVKREIRSANHLLELVDKMVKSFLCQSRMKAPLPSSLLVPPPRPGPSPPRSAHAVPISSELPRPLPPSPPHSPPRSHEWLRVLDPFSSRSPASYRDLPSSPPPPPSGSSLAWSSQIKLRPSSKPPLPSGTYSPDLPHPPRDPLKSDSTCRLQSVENLQMDGIKFKAHKDGEVKFQKRRFRQSILFLPKIYVDHDTEGLLRNLLAFDRETKSPDEEESAILCQFMILMNCLIQNRNDVAILRKEGVLVSRIGSDKDLAVMFSNLCKGLTDSIPYYEEEVQKVEEHSNKTLTKWMNWYREYLTKPWHVISVVAAAIIIALTAIQTVYIVKG